MDLKDGVWLLPIWGRPQGVRRLVRSVRESDPEARVVAILNRDDPQHLECFAELPAGWDYLVRGEDEGVAQALNAAVQCWPAEGFYGLLANDLTISQSGTLALLARECPDFGLSYCPDGIHNVRVATHPCVSGKLVRALGWWAYPEARHNGIDVYLMQCALEAGGMAYTTKGSFFHYHPVGQSAPIDAVHQRADSMYEQDKEADRLWELQGKAEAFARIKKAMQ